VACRLLVAHQDVLDLRVLHQHVVQGQVGAAGVTKDRVHLLSQQAFHDDLRTS
jgi:hypothetical protein